MLDQARLHQLFDYSQETGCFIRRVTTSSRALIGARAGYRTHGYRRIAIDGGCYYEHRLAWLYVNGTWPIGLLDHIDGDGENNRWGNIREASKAENLANSGLPCRNTSGAKGVVWHKKAEKWMAQIQIDGQHQYLGLFPDIESASAAYQRAAIEARGSFVRATP